jgi:hypothetical protein
MVRSGAYTWPFSFSGFSVGAELICDTSIHKAGSMLISLANERKIHNTLREKACDP